MRLIDVDALVALAYKGGAFDYQLVVDWSDIEDAPTIDAVSKDKVITCVTDIIQGYSDAHVITCAVCGLPFPDYGLEETTECRWCKVKNHSEFYAPCGPGYCVTTQDRMQKTYDKLFHSSKR